MLRVWHIIRRRLTLTAAALALVGLPIGGWAQDGDAEIPNTRPQATGRRPPVNMDVRIGLSNQINPKRPAPIRVTLQDNDEPISGRLLYRDPHGNTTELPVELPRKSQKQYALYIHHDIPLSESYEGFGFNPGTPFKDNFGEVTLLSERRVLARQSLAPHLSTQDLLVLSVSSEGAGLQFLAATDTEDNDRFSNGKIPFGEWGVIRVATLPPAELPRHWAGFDACDLVVLNGRTWLQLDVDQKRAFRMWVEQGGCAILCGDNPREWGDLDGLSLIGVRNPRVVPRRELASIAPWSGRGHRAREGSLLTLAGSLAAPDQTVFAEQGQPLVVHAPRLQGTVIWIGFDPLRESFRNSGLAEQFWTRALQTATKRHARVIDRPEPGSLSAVQAAVTTLPELNTPPREAFITFGVIYALIFGPLNIWVLRRMRRTVRAWLFMPALALGMTGVVLGVGQAWGENRNVLNGVTLLSATTGSRTALLHGRAGLFSPTNRSFNFMLPDPASALEEVIPTSNGHQILPPHVQRDEGGFWNRVAFQLFAVRDLSYRYPYDLQGSFSLSSGPDGAGEVRNETRLPLRNAFVYDADRRLYHWIGDLAAGNGSPLRPREWRKELPEPSSSSIASEPGRRFRNQIDALTRDLAGFPPGAGRIRRGLRLVAECSDFQPALQVSGLDYTHHAALLTVSAPSQHRASSEPER